MKVRHNNIRGGKGETTMEVSMTMSHWDRYLLTTQGATTVIVLAFITTYLSLGVHSGIFAASDSRIVSMFLVGFLVVVVLGSILVILGIRQFFGKKVVFRRSGDSLHIEKIIPFIRTLKYEQEIMLGKNPHLVLVSFIPLSTFGGYQLFLETEGKSHLLAPTPKEYDFVRDYPMITPIRKFVFSKEAADEISSQLNIPLEVSGKEYGEYVAKLKEGRDGLRKFGSFSIKTILWLVVIAALFLGTFFTFAYYAVSFLEEDATDTVELSISEDKLSIIITGDVEQVLHASEYRHLNSGEHDEYQKVERRYDFNNDGYLDLDAIVLVGSEVTQYALFVFDPEQERFNFVQHLTNLSIDEPTGRITVGGGSKTSTYVTTYFYEWDGEKLVEVESSKKAKPKESSLCPLCWDVVTADVEAFAIDSSGDYRMRVFREGEYEGDGLRAGIYEKNIVEIKYLHHGTVVVAPFWSEHKNGTTTEFLKFLQILKKTDKGYESIGITPEKDFPVFEIRSIKNNDNGQLEVELGKYFSSDVEVRTYESSRSGGLFLKLVEEGDKGFQSPGTYWIEQTSTFVNCHIYEMFTENAKKIEVPDEVQQSLNCVTGAEQVSPNGEYLSYSIGGIYGVSTSSAGIKIFNPDNGSILPIYETSGWFDGVACTWKDTSDVLACVLLVGQPKEEDALGSRESVIVVAEITKGGEIKEVHEFLGELPHYHCGTTCYPNAIRFKGGRVIEYDVLWKDEVREIVY